MRPVDPPKDPGPLSPTARTTLRRYPDRGRQERSELYRVLDAGLLCYLGVVADGSPRVMPMVYGRIGDTLYLHGSVMNQTLRAATTSADVCITVVNVHGLVLANSLFHHSVNFESAMVYGPCRLVTCDEERLNGIRAAAEQLVPGRAPSLGDPTAKQLAATMVVAVGLEEASVKVRQGPPNGEPADYELDIWAGVVPLVQTWGEPEVDPKVRGGIPVPEHVAHLVRQPVGRGASTSA